MKLTKSQLKRIIKEELGESLEDRLGGPEGGDPSWRVDIPKDPEELRDFLDGIAKSIELLSDEEARAADDARAFFRIGTAIMNAEEGMDRPREGGEL